MPSTLYLHVGAPKSGTTYLQRVLDANRQRLGEAGVLLVGRRHLDLVHAAMEVRDDPRLSALGERASGAWERLVAEIGGWSGDKAILSYELFAGASQEQVRRALADLGDIDVHVVVTARDLARAVPSAWQERLKFALTTPLEEWRPKPESAGPRAEWGWRTMDPSSVATRWGATLPADRVHIVTVPRSPATPGELWRRFASACALDDSGFDLEIGQVNESMGVVAAELLRRVNGEIAPPIDSDREYAAWLRDTLAHRVLADLDREPIGTTDAQFEEASTRSKACIAAIGAAGYAVHGDLEDLRATRVGARTPGQVTEAELVGAAARAIAGLLVLVRDAGRAADPDHESSEESPALLSRGRRAARRAVDRRIHARADRLQARVEQLEAELHRGRALHLRVAELTDLVSELLLPGPEGTTELVDTEGLEAYRRESL